jgi:hypothetical protein
LLEVQKGKSLLAPQSFLVIREEVEEVNQDFPFRDLIAKAVPQDRRQRRRPARVVEPLLHQVFIPQVLHRLHGNIDPGAGTDPDVCCLR